MLVASCSSAASVTRSVSQARHYAWSIRAATRMAFRSATSVGVLGVLRSRNASASSCRAFRSFTAVSVIQFLPNLYLSTAVIQPVRRWDRAKLARTRMGPGQWRITVPGTRHASVGVPRGAGRYAVRRSARNGQGSVRQRLANRYSQGRWNLGIRTARTLGRAEREERES